MDSNTTNADARGLISSDEKSVTENGPRRGGRARKATSKAGGAGAKGDTNFEKPTASSSNSKKQHASESGDDLINQDVTEQGVANSRSEASLSDTHKDKSIIEERSDENEDGSDSEEYCLCRGPDNGSFMISCERCQEWFHTRCIGMTQKEAKKLDEYICEACQTNSLQITEASSKGKGTKKYGASKNLKKTHRDRAISSSGSKSGSKEPESASEDVDRDDEDNYVVEGNAVSDDENMQEEVATATASTSSGIQLEASKAASNGRELQRPVKRKEDAEQITQSPKKARTSSSSLGIGSESHQKPSNVDASASSEGGRKSSSSHKPLPRKTQASSDSATEEARARARKVLADALIKIFSMHPSDASMSVVVSDDEAKIAKDSAAEKGELYALHLEQKLYDSYADISGSIRVVGTKYKDRFRTFLFSLKDSKNTTLHSRIASGDLLATELAKMTSDELANDAIRLASEKARLEALQRSTLRAESAGPMRKITHKGEIEIESEVLDSRDQPGKFQRSKPDGEAGQSQKEGHGHDGDKASATSPLGSESAPVVPSLPGPMKLDEMAEDSSDFKEDLQVEETLPSVPAPAHSLQSPPSQVDFENVWAPNRSVSFEPEQNDDEPRYTRNNLDLHDGPFAEHGYEGNKTDSGPLDGVDDFIDSFLEGKQDSSSESAPTDAGSKHTVLRSTTPLGKPPGAVLHRYRSVIWNGLIDLPDIFAVQGHVKQIAGRPLIHKPSAVSSFFPDRSWLLAGRLPSKAGFDYLLQTVNASRTELVIFTLEPGLVKDGTIQATESDQASFDGLMKHFKQADRWGALQIHAKAKNVLIKDFYLIPLYKDEEIPLWLDKVHTDCLGSDWHSTRDRDFFLMVAVVFKEALQVELSKEDLQQIGTKARSLTDDRMRADSASLPLPDSQLAEGRQVVDFTPPAGTGVPLSAVTTATPAVATGSTFGSDALQSLLRSLGKSTPPSSSEIAPNATTKILSPFAQHSPPELPTPGPAPGPSPPPIVAHGAGRIEPSPGAWYGPQAQQPAGSPTYPSQNSWKQPHQPYAAADAGLARGGSYAQHQGWAQAHNYNDGYNVPTGPAYTGAPQLPEEEYPGQYNPDYLAQSLGRGHVHTFGGRGRGRGDFARGRGRGWPRGRGW